MAYEAPSFALPPRRGLRLHRIGAHGDVVDHEGHVREFYGLSPGDCVLVRPDGCIGAVVSAGDAGALETYLASVMGPSR